MCSHANTVIKEGHLLQFVIVCLLCVAVSDSADSLIPESPKYRILEETETENRDVYIFDHVLHELYRVSLSLEAPNYCL